MTQPLIFNGCTNDTIDALTCEMWAFLTDHVFRRILCGCREIARSEFGTIRSAPCTQLHHCCEGEERHVRWPDAEVFACLLTKNPANASDTDSSGRLFATPALRDDAMVEVNVERENPRSHNSRSRNSIGTSTVSLCATYQSRSRLRYKLSFKTLHLSSLSRFLSTCMSFAPAPIAEFYPQYHIREIQTCVLSTARNIVRYVTVHYYSCTRCCRIHYSSLVLYLFDNAISIASCVLWFTHII